MLPGQTLLTVSLTDADSPINGSPFKLKISGNGATAFAFDPLQNLITTQRISFSEKKDYNLTVIATDSGGLQQSCDLKIFVKQQSKFPPEVSPLLITLNTLMGEYLGGKIGKITATDKVY